MKIGLTDLPKKYKQHPMLKGIPDEIKDVERYKQIEKEYALIMLSSHKHKTPASMVACKECSSKMEQRREYVHKLGIKDYAQFMLYRRVMNLIINNGVQL